MNIAVGGLGGLFVSPAASSIEGLHGCIKALRTVVNTRIDYTLYLRTSHSGES